MKWGFFACWVFKWSRNSLVEKIPLYGIATGLTGHSEGFKLSETERGQLGDSKKCHLTKVQHKPLLQNSSKTLQTPANPQQSGMTHAVMVRIFRGKKGKRIKLL